MIFDIEKLWNQSAGVTIGDPARIEDGNNLSMSKRELKSLLAGSSDGPTRKSRLRGSNRDLTMTEGTQVEADWVGGAPIRAC